MASVAGEQSAAFAVELLTPLGKVLESRTFEVKLPTVDGQIGILTRHIPYIGLVGTGLIEFVTHDTNEVVRAVVAGGFCSFSGNTLTVLADHVDLPEDVDADSYAEQRETLQAIIAKGNQDTHEVQRAREDLARIEAIDRLISH
ncbi:MAG: ATP synthase F1 subunit epsilon [Bdellovibrionales bacterium]|nr:ATP synthase F1 subunit epsilon [Bdellovibrionales bacterium]